MRTRVSFNGVLYTYIHNLQGDIVGILDSSGTLVVEYKYDAWGKLLSVTGNLADTLGKRNPFRYRGYVYDEETGLYYLRSRYYNPTVGRFVNADTLLGNVGALGSHNLFAYCANNPVKRCDPDGYAWYDGILNALKKAGAYLKDCFQAQVQADLVSAEQTVHAANQVTSSVKSLVSRVKTAVSDWWNNTAVPWLNDLRKANLKAAEINANMTIEASRRIDNWLGNPDWGHIGKQTAITGFASGAGGAIVGGITAALGAPFTAGFSIVASAAISGFVGVAGGVVEGFISSFIEEIWQ